MTFPRAVLSLWARCSIVLCLLSGLAAAEPASPPSLKDDLYLIGGLDNLRHLDRRVFGTVQLRFAHQLFAQDFALRPYAQAGLAHAGSVYAGVGLAHEFKLARRLSLLVGSGPGYYRHRGNDPDLGYGLEFASWVELSATIFDRRLGLTFAHLSNAHLGARNPGTEGVALSLLVHSW